jgi:hypothetical protein
VGLLDHVRRVHPAAQAPIQPQLDLTPELISMLAHELIPYRCLAGAKPLQQSPCLWVLLTAELVSVRFSFEKMNRHRFSSHR